MTKAGLEMMISSLKDRCKETMGTNRFTIEPPHAFSCQHHKASSSLSADQVVSLTALIAYVAHMTGQTEFRVERDLSNHFCVPNPKCLSQEQYDNAICFMVEQVPVNRC